VQLVHNFQQEKIVNKYCQAVRICAN